MPRSSILVASCAALASGLTACGPAAPVASPSAAVVPEGRYRELVEAQIKPWLDAELVHSLVVGLYSAGKTEVYGFGAGPGGAPPDGNTLYELGPVTKVYTSLLFGDAVQRREVQPETPLAELLPPGVTVPIRDKVAITLNHLALHVAGLPRWPPSVVARQAEPDPFANYSEEALYRDLIQTELAATPGTQISYSSFGAGVLGFVLGTKLGGGYPKLLVDRVLRPLELGDTFLTVPETHKARRAAGTTDDLAPAPAWTFGALAGAAGLISTARDQLRLIAAEIDAAEGGSQRPLHKAMQLSQEPALDRAGVNQSLGWMIDSTGRYAHSGSTAGFHAFVSFDPKTRHGVVVLASTATALVDRIGDAMYRILAADPDAPPAAAALAGPADLAAVAGRYELSGTKLAVVVAGKRLYLDAPGEPRRRLAPIGSREFWIESLQSVVVFQDATGGAADGGAKIARAVFVIGNRSLSATRVD